MKINLNSEIDKQVVDEVFQEYKVFLPSVLAISVSILLFLFLLLPQLFSLSSKQAKSASEQGKLTQLKDTQEFLSGVDLTTLSSDFTLTNSVLPTTKDFEAPINAIISASSDSGAQIQSYQFQNVSISSSNSTLASYPMLVFEINLDATPQQTVDFVSSIYKKAPISEVETISGTDTTATVSIAFFYKPFSPTNEINATDVRDKNSGEKSAMKEIEGWNVSIFETSTGSPQTSTQSATDNGPF